MTTVEKRQREDEALIKRFAETRSPAMRDQVVERFMPLARSLASRYRLHSEPFEDILQVANLGLVKAVDGFDPARGTPFPGYAVPTILGELRRHFRDHVWNLRLPRGLQELVLKIDHVTEELTDELGALPTVKQVAERLELPQEVVLEGLEAANARRTDSLDRPMTAGVNPQTVGESLGGDDFGFDSVEAKASIGSADVSGQELEILRMRFVDGMKQKDIAEICGCSQMQISRISRATIWKLVCAVRGEPAGPVPRATGR